MQINLFSQTVFQIDKVLKPVKKAKINYLFRAGNYLRTAAKRNVKVKRGGNDLENFTFKNEFGREQTELFWRKSEIGHSPFDHTGWRNTFHFGVDVNKEIVDVGALDGKNHIPPLHEFGGIGIIKYSVLDRSGKRHERTKQHVFRKRETMKPALERSIKYISSFWKNVIYKN